MRVTGMAAIFLMLGATAAVAQVPPPSHPEQSADKSHGVKASGAEDDTARTPVQGKEGQPRSSGKESTAASGRSADDGGKKK